MWFCVVLFFRDICDLAEKYNALTFIDECHATGFFGDTGRQVLRHFLSFQVPHMATHFAKAQSAGEIRHAVTWKREIRYVVTSKRGPSCCDVKERGLSFCDVKWEIRHVVTSKREICHVVTSKERDPSCDFKERNPPCCDVKEEICHVVTSKRETVMLWRQEVEIRHVVTSCPSGLFQQWHKK